MDITQVGDYKARCQECKGTQFYMTVKTYPSLDYKHPQTSTYLLCVECEEVVWQINTIPPTKKQTEPRIISGWDQGLEYLADE